MYRILSLESFVDLLHNKRERYVRPSTWEDTFEGYLFSKIYDSSEQKKLIEDIYFNVCPRNYESTINNILKLEHSKWFVYGQCWSTEADSDAMWRIYSYGNHSIQIQTTEKRIKDMLSQEEGIRYCIENVKYDVSPKDDLLHKQVMQLKDTQKPYEPFLHKRRAFKHENEKRVLIDDMNWFSMTKLSSMGANWKISEQVAAMNNDEEIIKAISDRLSQYLNQWKTDTLPNEFYVESIDLKKYITGVKVNPFAEDWYVKLIADLCKEYGIKFNGRSKLYKLD